MAFSVVLILAIVILLFAASSVFKENEHMRNALIDANKKHNRSVNNSSDILAKAINSKTEFLSTELNKAQVLLENVRSEKEKLIERIKEISLQVEVLEHDHEELRKARNRIFELEEMDRNPITRYKEFHSRAENTLLRFPARITFGLKLEIAKIELGCPSEGCNIWLDPDQETCLQHYIKQHISKDNMPD